MCIILDKPEPVDAATDLDMKHANVTTSPVLIGTNLAMSLVPVLTLYAVPSVNLPATKLLSPFALIDALNEKHSITTSLVRALESVPPSIASSSSDEQNAEHDDDEQDDGDRKYFRRCRHPTTLLNRIRTKH